MPDEFRIATRESALAMWQANHVRDRLAAAFPKTDFQIVGMTTQGDRDKSSPLSRIGGKGVFVKELEQGLLAGTVDVAVHSMKDVPAELPAGLEIAGICQREDPRDAFVSNHYQTLADLPAGARVGTSSLRRRLQLKKMFPTLEYPEVRGNVDTRLRKLDEGEFDAIILATAGLKRLGYDGRIAERIDPAISIPAAGQGAVGIECVSANDEVRRMLDEISDANTKLCVECERLVSIGLGATCNLPIAAFARVEDGVFRMAGYVSDLDGKHDIHATREGRPEDARALAGSLVEELLDAGGRDLVAASDH